MKLKPKSPAGHAPVATGPATPSSKPQPRAWQRMLSGRRLDLLDPSPLDIEIEDIAHGLARVARWNGQTLGDHAFSVAQHVILVERICCDLDPGFADKWRRAALLHDAAEYVVGDLISPFKNAIGLDYRAFENRLLEAVHMRFDLPARLPDTVVRRIKTADRISAYYEAVKLAGFETTEASAFFGTPPGLSSDLKAELEALAPWPAKHAQVRLLEAFQSVF